MEVSLVAMFLHFLTPINNYLLLFHLSLYYGKG